MGKSFQKLLSLIFDKFGYFAHVRIYDTWTPFHSSCKVNGAEQMSECGGQTQHPADGKGGDRGVGDGENTAKDDESVGDHKSENMHQKTENMKRKFQKTVW